MRRLSKGISTIETLVLVGLLGILLFMSLESYRSHLITLERNLTIIDFDQTVELIEKEFLFIKKALVIEPKDSRPFSLSLDTSTEWWEIVRSKVDLGTNNVAITLLNGSIADNNLIISVGLRAGYEFEQKSQLICWEVSLSECLAN